MRYFQSINVPLLELYGMSECTGVATLSYPRSCKVTAVGKVILESEVKIFNQDEDGSGEVETYLHFLAIFTASHRIF